MPSLTMAGCLVPRLNGTFKATVRLTLPSISPSGQCRTGKFFWRFTAQGLAKPESVRRPPDRGQGQWLLKLRTRARQRVLHSFSEGGSATAVAVRPMPRLYNPPLRAGLWAWLAGLRLAHTSSRYRSTTCIAYPLTCFAYRSGYSNVAGSSQTQRG